MKILFDFIPRKYIVFCLFKKWKKFFLIRTAPPLIFISVKIEETLSYKNQMFFEQFFYDFEEIVLIVNFDWFDLVLKC